MSVRRDAGNKARSGADSERNDAGLRLPVERADDSQIPVADQTIIDADLRYLGIEAYDPVRPANLALKAVIVGLLALIFVLDLSRATGFNTTAFYVVAIFLALRLGRVRWVIGVTAVSLLLNLVSVRWQWLYPPPGWTIKNALDDIGLALFAQIPAGVLAYQAILSQRRLERVGKETARRQRTMYERERAARNAEQEARRREQEAMEQLRTHAVELDVSLANERQARRREREAVFQMDQLRALTESFQRTLLPTVPSEIARGRLVLGPFYQPAIHEMRMGGDFYDATTLPNGMVGLVIGDVAGHGVESAAQTALVTSTLRAFAMEDPVSPGAVLSRVNRSLTRDRNFEGFASVFYGVFDPRTNMLRYANAGHEPPILISGDGRYARLDSTGLVVGVDTEVVYSELDVKLVRDDCIVMFTDGITEARDPATGQLFGWKNAADIALQYRARVLKSPRQAGTQSNMAMDLAEEIYRNALLFAGIHGGPGQGLSDDVALLIAVVLNDVRTVPEAPSTLVRS